MASPSAFAQTYSANHSPSSMSQDSNVFAALSSRQSPQRGDSTLSLNTMQNPDQSNHRSPRSSDNSATTYQIGTQSTRASPTNELSSVLPTTDEEWAKVADAVERRRVQNRNAQRKYRKKCKLRAEELERRKAQGVFNSVPNSLRSTPEPRSRMATPQASSQISSRRTSSVPGLRHRDSISSARSSSLSRVREYTPILDEQDVAYPQFRHRHSDLSSASSDTNTQPDADHMYSWLSTDPLVAQPLGMEPMTFSEPMDLNQSFCNDTAAFPSMFPISSVPQNMFPGDLYNSSEGTISPQSTKRSNGHSRERAASVGGDLSMGRTMVHTAALRGNNALLLLLLEKGADPNVKDIHGFTPLHLAIENCHNETADLLIQHGAIFGPTTDQWLSEDQSFFNEQPWVKPEQTWIQPEQTWLKQETS